jgi:hypothetical protein
MSKDVCGIVLVEQAKEGGKTLEMGVSLTHDPYLLCIYVPHTVN